MLDDGTALAARPFHLKLDFRLVILHWENRGQVFLHVQTILRGDSGHVKSEDPTQLANCAEKDPAGVMPRAHTEARDSVVGLNGI